MVDVILGGALGERFGERFELEIQTPAEAVRALSSQLEGFREYLTDRHFVVVANNTSHDELSIHSPVSNGVVEIQPALEGAGGRGGQKVLLGAVLIGASFIPGLGSVAAASLGRFGVAMLLSGASALLMPKQNTKDSEREFTTISNRANVVRAGVPIPLVIGRCEVGSVIVAAATDSRG